jgi:uncharacterized protein YndB with AHSA1/START domain
MWKWIGGIVLFVIVCLMAAAWWGFRKISSTFEPDGSVRVAIAAPAARVFASLSDADSSSTWMASGSKISTGKHGPFGIGDSIRIEIKAVGNGRPVTWKVSNVVPGQSISMQLQSPDPRHPFVATRLDSIFQVGDSTVVIDRITAVPAPTGTAEQMMLSMFKFQSKVELMTLKSRIEGTGRF